MSKKLKLHDETKYCLIILEISYVIINPNDYAHELQYSSPTN